MSTFKAVAIGLGVATVAIAAAAVIYNRPRTFTEMYNETLSKDLVGMSRSMSFTTVSHRTYFGKDTNTYTATLAVKDQGFTLRICDTKSQPCELTADLVQRILREFNVEKHFYAERYTNNQFTIAAK